MRVLRVCTLVLTVILVCASQPVPAQSPGGVGQGTSLLPGFSANGLASVMPFTWSSEDWAGSIPSVRPCVRVGYSKMGLNLNLPIPIAAFGLSALDLQVLDANLWTGAVLFDVDVTSGLRLFFIGKGNAQRNVTAITFPEPTFIILPIEWTGSKLEWWAVEGGVAYTVMNGVGLLVGLRRDHWSLGLTDPRFMGIPLVPTTFLAYSGDIQTKMWIPYFGLEFIGPNYQVRLIGSPFPWVEAKLPLSFNLGGNVFANSKYELKKSGAFLELDFAYQVQPVSNVAFGIWGNLSWLRARGRGTDELTVAVAPISASTSSSATSTLSRHCVGGGLSVELTF